MGYYEDLDKQIDRELGLDDEAVPRQRAPGLLSRVFRLAWRWTMAATRYVLGWVFLPIIRPMRFRAVEDPEGPRMVLIRQAWTRRLLEGLVTRVVLTPVILGLFFLTLVWLTTHPQRVNAMQTPAKLGLFYKPVTLTSSDGELLAAWYLPPITADAVVKEGDAVLASHWPAVVLVHGLGLSHDQYLPLAFRLHEAGFAVLMLDLRGQGESGGGAVTFGLRERRDVLAAVRYLSDIPSIEPRRIGVVGYGIGGQAALQAAALDASIAAVSVESVDPSFDAFTRQALQVPYAPTNWLASLYGLAFEMSLREHADQLDLEPLLRRLNQQHVLFVVHSAGVQGRPRAGTQEVLAAAQESPGVHHVLVLDDKAESLVKRDQATVTFLCDTMGWVPPKDRLPEAVQKLLGAQVH